VDELVAQGNRCLVSETREWLDKASAAFNSAIDKDPKFALAYVGLFEVRVRQYTGFENVSADAQSNLRVAATNLIEIAPNLAEARMASSFLKSLDGHLDGALADARRATKMRLGSKENGGGLVHILYGWYLEKAGRTDEALRELLTRQRHAKPVPSSSGKLGRLTTSNTTFQRLLRTLRSPSSWSRGRY
jgi:Tfp pilus assembly protein PilF